MSEDIFKLDDPFYGYKKTIKSIWIFLLIPMYFMFFLLFLVMMLK